MEQGHNLYEGILVEFPGERHLGWIVKNEKRSCEKLQRWHSRKQGQQASAGAHK